MIKPAAIVSAFVAGEGVYRLAHEADVAPSEVEDALRRRIERLQRALATERERPCRHCGSRPKARR